MPRSAVYDAGQDRRAGAGEERGGLHRLGDQRPVGRRAGARLPSVPAVADVVAGIGRGRQAPGGRPAVSVNGTPSTSPDAVNAILSATKPGDTATIAFTRDGAAQTATVTLGSGDGRPAGRARRRAGRLPKDGRLTINLGGIGGPSAGLMFSLGIVDKLTPGELTGGRFVAGTGAIDRRRHGVEHRRHPVQDGRRAGRGRHRLPPARGRVHRGRRPPRRAGLQLIKVGTLHDAVTALNALMRARTPPGCTA